MIDKKEFLLEQIIKAYILNLVPIGSSQLKSIYDIRYSSATIRGYFKKLGDEGFLEQEHASSGRIPTTEALKQYWQNRLIRKLDLVDLQLVEILAYKIGLSVFIKKICNDILENIIGLNNKHIILEFSTFTIIVKYSDVLYRFLNGLIDFDAQHILNISKQVGAFEIYDKLDTHLQKRDFKSFNIKEFLTLGVSFNYTDNTIEKFLNGKILEECKEGLYFEEFFPHNYIGICHNCIIENTYTKMLVVGEMSKDYDYFYNQIAHND